MQALDAFDNPITDAGENSVLLSADNDGMLGSGTLALENGYGEVTLSKAAPGETKITVKKDEATLGEHSVTFAAAPETASTPAPQEPATLVMGGSIFIPEPPTELAPPLPAAVLPAQTALASEDAPPPLASEGTLAVLVPPKEDPVPKAHVLPAPADLSSQEAPQPAKAKSGVLSEQQADAAVSLAALAENSSVRKKTGESAWVWIFFGVLALSLLTFLRHKIKKPKQYKDI
jgi:hypothetical protein